jgi:hypothetical protein
MSKVAGEMWKLGVVVLGWLVGLVVGWRGWYYHR